MQIHNELLALRASEKKLTSEILEKLQQMEDLKGYLNLGYSSLFDYLVRGLNYSESIAYQRQACVRLARELPEVKEKLDQGALTVSTVAAAFKHIRKQSTEGKREVLSTLENKSAREVKKILTPVAAPIEIKKTVYQDKVHLRLELSHELNAKLEKLKALKSHKHSLESLLEDLIDKELLKFENSKMSSKPVKTHTNPRYISRRLRNLALEKAHYKCQKQNCNETHFLQIDHIIPVRVGGRATADNIQVLCAAHNLAKG